MSSSEPNVLETERLALRRLTMDDLDALASIYSDADDGCSPTDPVTADPDAVAVVLMPELVVHGPGGSSR